MFLSPWMLVQAVLLALGIWWCVEMFPRWRDDFGLDSARDLAQSGAVGNKLEQRGCIRLPPKRRPSPNRMLHKKVPSVAHAREPINDPLAQLRPLEVIELSQRPDALSLYKWLLHQYHYLSYASPVGLNLKYLVRDRQGRPLSCLLFGAAAWKCAVRDQFIGWGATVREARLQQLTDNTRFLILPWVQVPHLASHALSHRLQAPLKRVWVYPLDPQFRRHLCA